MISHRWRHPIRWRRGRAERARRPAEHAAHEARIAALPRFDGPPPGLDLDALHRDGSTSWDTREAPDGHYVLGGITVVVDNDPR